MSYDTTDVYETKREILSYCNKLSKICHGWILRARLAKADPMYDQASFLMDVVNDLCPDENAVKRMGVLFFMSSYVKNVKN